MLVLKVLKCIHRNKVLKQTQPKRKCSKSFILIDFRLSRRSNERPNVANPLNLPKKIQENRLRLDQARKSSRAIWTLMLWRPKSKPPLAVKKPKQNLEEEQITNISVHHKHFFQRNLKSYILMSHLLCFVCWKRKTPLFHVVMFSTLKSFSKILK